MLNRCVAALLCVLLCLSDFGIAQTGSSYSSKTRPTAQECESRPDLVGCEGLRDEADQVRVGAGTRSFEGSRIERSDTPEITIGGEDTTSEQIQDKRTSFGKKQVAAVQIPVEDASEFQKFVESSLGKRLPVFGRNLFSNVPSTFAQVDRVPVTADYVIGPGDELLIHTWGQININARVVVDRGGEIFLPKVGSIPVAGFKYQQLDDYLKTSIGRVFRNFDLTVTLGQLRSIQVFVVGYARRPGAYTVSSLSTLVNALFASGGPSSRGSMRHIQVKRNNEVVTDFDLYELLLKGDKSRDIVLMPGDVIYIPAVGPQVAISGSVNLPAIYEMHSTETLGEQIDIAGGLTNVADGGRAIVERIDDHTTRNIEEFTLDQEGFHHGLKDGDLVRIFSISPKFENAVTIRGNVAEPGRYPWHAGMRVRDLIPNREFLLTREFWLKQNGSAADSSLISDWQLDSGKSRSLGDRYAGSTIASTDPLEAETSVPETDVRRSESPMSGRDLLQQEDAGSESQAEFRNDVKRDAPAINWDYAVVQRINPSDLSPALIPFNLGKAVLENSEQDNVLLQPGDIITIFSQRDMAVGLDRQTKFVRLEGEFRAPGVYKVERGETLRSLVARAGGLSDGAYLFGTQFTRESARIEQQKSLNRMIRDMQIDVERLSLTASGAAGETKESLQARTQSQRALVERFSAIRATGRVVLEIDSKLTGLDVFPEIALEDGDRVYVPHKPETVSVLGAVYNPNSFLFKPGMKVSDYLKMAGSGTRESDMKHTFVIRADGSVLSDRTQSGMWSGGLGSIRIVPGDTVMVPAQLDKGTFMRGFKDWTQIFSQMALGAAAINILR